MEKKCGRWRVPNRVVVTFSSKKYEKKVFQKKLKVVGKQIVAGRKSRDNRKT